MFVIELTDSAQDDLRYLRRFDQTLVMDAIDEQLRRTGQRDAASKTLGTK
jgi:hypothetical protein